MLKGIVKEPSSYAGLGIVALGVERLEQQPWVGVALIVVGLAAVLFREGRSDA